MTQFRADAAAPSSGFGAWVGSRPVGLSSLELLVTGSVAGVVAKTVTAPLDRVRLIYQVTPSKVYSLRDAVQLARDIARLGGPQGLWYGHKATVYRVVPFAGIQFLAFETVQSKLVQKSVPSTLSPYWIPACAGAAAAVTATVATYPLDVLRTRIAGHLEAVPRYRDYSSAFQTILKIEGFRGLFRGLSPTLLGIGPYGAMSFCAFESAKRKLRQWHQVPTDSDVPLLHRLAAATLSGATAQLLSYPMQTVRRRMQFPYPEELGAQGSLAYANLRDTFRQIQATEGLAALYKGASIVWMKGPLTVGLAFVVNDALKGYFHRRHASDEHDQYIALPGRGHVTDGTAQKLSAVESLVVGGAAGATAKTVIAPLDRVKIIYQTDKTRHFSWHDVIHRLKDIYNVEGVPGLWRGHGATLLRVVPYSAISFTVFDPYKAGLRRALPDLSDVQVRFVAGAAAGATATSFTYPLDLLRARMAAHQGAAAYDGYLRAVSQIIKNEGAWALWSGWKPTLLGREQSIGRCVYVVFEIGLAFVLQAGPKEALNLKHSKFESSPIPNANATLNQACTSFRISHGEIKTKHES
ncbi:unnamed protein product [Effrenium voratum]|nr:unnamed protein product [Effrenium voratum]CAJ1455750.1 unnamed protein product [Effrenium voratum]